MATRGRAVVAELTSAARTIGTPPRGRGGGPPGLVRQASRKGSPRIRSGGGSALVLDGHKVHALDIVRTLGRAGISVAVGASHADAIAFGSRFATRCEVYPDPALDAEAFVGWLAAELGKGSCDLVIPVTDVTVIPISRNLERLQRFCAIATPPFDVLEQVTDKRRTLDVARRVGVPHPATVVVHDVGGLERLGSWRFPVVCKPMTSGVWSATGYVGMQVFYALDEQELRREVSRCLPTCPVMLQEYRRGAGVGVEVLARDGVILQAFQHQRLHELPLTGGGSTYRMSVPVDPMLLDYASRLLAAIGWTGVAMVEFRIDA
jgi:predicted ATP-grasp superfamily ATP-dependent carboligase